MSLTNSVARLTGKVALVTGASKGIGASIAEKLATEGASVAVNYNQDSAGANVVVDRIKERGGKAFAVRANVSDANQAKFLVEQTIGEFGKLNVLVNNAGVLEFRMFADITEEYIDQYFDVGVKGLLLVTQAAVRAFGTLGGKIINISSVGATMPPPGSTVASATKGAVDTITRALAFELGAKNILVNSISPGLTETPGLERMNLLSVEFNESIIGRTALRRLGKPDDIAGAVALLASDEANWITGQVIQVSGGLRL